MSSAERLRSETAFARGMLRGASFAPWFAVSLWAADVASLAMRADSPRALLQSAWVALAATLPWVLVLAPATGFLLALAGVPPMPAPKQHRSRWQSFADSGAEGSARLLSAATSFCVFVAGSYLLASKVLAVMHQDMFKTLGVALGVGAWLLVSAGLHVPLHGLARLCVQGVAAASAQVGAVIARPTTVGVVLTLLAAVSGGVVLALRWTWVQALPWEPSLKVGGALVAALAAVAWIPTAGASLLLRAAAGIAVAAAVAAVALLGPRRAASVEAAQADAIGAALGYAALRAVFDFDRDGQLGFAGDGDCGPRNARIHTGAVDVFGNRVDEDCDGADAKPIVIPRGLHAYRRPVGVPVPKQVFLLTIDALQFDRVFARVQGQPVMPALEALASKSVYFDAAFSAGSVTKNGFPGVFASRYSSQLEYSSARNPPGIAAREFMLAELLAAKGYDTLAVLPNVYFFPETWAGFTQGFSDLVRLPNTSRHKGGIHNAPSVRAAAIEALSKREPDAPLFAWVHFFDAHTPYTRAQEIKGPFEDTMQGTYDTEVALIDRELGELIRFIEQRGYSAPLIIVTADHGTSFDPRHKKKYGEDLYSDIVQVPLVISGSGFSARRIASVVSTIDIAPTVANLLGITRKLPFEGVSLVPELTTGQSVVKRILHHQLWDQERVRTGGDPLRAASVRDERYHFILDKDAARAELYAYRSDPLERRNLVRDPKHRAVAVRMRATLSQLLARVRSNGKGSD